jgi:hypothetical protein
VNHSFLFSVFCFGLFTGTPLFAAPVEKTELQWALCEPSAAVFAQKARASLGSSAQRDLYYLETPSQELLSKNAFVRIRDEGGSQKITAKVNYADDHDLPWSILKNKESKCEWDRYGDYQKVGCSMNEKTKGSDADLSGDQKNFLRQETGFDHFTQMKLLGPAASEAWVWHQDDLDLDVSMESVRAPHGFFSLEFSARVDTADADDTYKLIQGWLSQHQIQLCPVQRGKSEALIRALQP